MTVQSRQRWALALLMTCAVAMGTGCNMLSLPYFLMMGADNLEPPKCMKLSTEDKKDKDKEIKVVIFASNRAETRPEFVRVDREISEHLARKLKEYYAEKKEKVTILPLSQVEKFKDEHHDWKSWELREIGGHFEADFVIDLEVHAIGLYEKGSGNTLYRGQTEITVRLLPMKRAEEGAAEQIFSCEYPKTRGPVATDDLPYAQFRRNFMEYVGKRLSWYFIPHPTDDEISCE